MSTQMSVDMVQLRPSVKTSGHPPGGHSSLSFGSYQHEARPDVRRSPTSNGFLAPRQWAPAAEPVWSEHVAGTGQKYYYNKITRESTWERPAELGPDPGGKVSPKAGPSVTPSASPYSVSSRGADNAADLAVKFKLLQARESDAQARITDLETRQRLADLEYKQRLADVELQYRALIADLEMENRNLKSGHTAFEMELDELKRRHKDFDSQLQTLLRSQNLNDVTSLRMQLADLQIKVMQGRAAESRLSPTKKLAEPLVGVVPNQAPDHGSSEALVASPQLSPGNTLGAGNSANVSLGFPQQNRAGQASGSYGYNPPGGRSSIVMAFDPAQLAPAGARVQRPPVQPQQDAVRIHHPPGGASSFTFG
eukprot:TRINITY_DN3463_c0_g1_i3.p1 TRINITY_DN3463_c0_g1~~TRINITY_DN3463_c0_g1_i3.p1  ORF type:complete len:366 (-),score=45.24 TRINITY_DN3463_c0_g1_i3:443-1540(-)